MTKKQAVLHTPDGRYIVVRGRLWRATNPHLSEETRQHWVQQLMAARRAVRTEAGDPDGLRQARQQVDEAKHALGERGPPWWQDGARDYNRCLAKNSPYADWFQSQLQSTT